MKIEEQQYGKVERKLIIGMMTNPVFLGRICSKWDQNLFMSPDFNRIAQWCREHYLKSKEAPCKGISHYIESWGESYHSEAEVDRLAQLYNSLTEEEYGVVSELSLEILNGIADKHFTRVRQTRLVEEINSDLAVGKVTRADERITKYSKYEGAVAKTTSLLIDEEAIRAAFSSENRDQLIDFPDGLGQFFREVLRRGQFIAFCGPQKVSKTRWLIDFSYRSVQARKKTLFIGVGDLSEQEINEIFMTRIARWPTFSPDGKWPLRVEIPEGIVVESKNNMLQAVLTTKTKEFLHPLDGDAAVAAVRRFNEKSLKSNQSYLETVAYPNMSVNMYEIKSLIDSLILRDWYPDVVVLDYADNLNAVDKKEEPRDRVNTNWKLLRALAMEYNCLVVTATQTNVLGFNKWVLDRTNFSEDNRKLSHVTGFVGINVTADEKAKDITRLNWIVKRYGDYVTTRCCFCAGVMGMAYPSMVSVYPRYNSIKKGKKEE